MNTPATIARMPIPMFRISIRLKILGIFTLLFTVVFAVAFYWFYQFATRLTLDNLASEMRGIAENAAQGIDGDQHAALFRSAVPAGAPLTIHDDRYWSVVRWLALTQRVAGKIKAPNGSEDYRIQLYTYVPTDKPRTVAFVGSSSANIYLTPDGSIYENTAAKFSGATFREAYQPKSQEMLDGLRHTTVNITHPISDTWGRWYSAFAPIHNAQGQIVGAVGMDVHDTTVETIERQIKSAILPAFLLTYAVLFIAVFVISYGISRPIVQLTRAVQHVAEGSYGDDVIPATSGTIHDETTTLAAVFRQMVAKVAAREQKLKQQVQELKIEIDQAKQEKQVEEITDTDYFRELQSKARMLRARAAIDQLEPSASVEVRENGGL